MLEYPSISEVLLKLTVAKNSLNMMLSVLETMSSSLGSSSGRTNGRVLPS